MKKLNISVKQCHILFVFIIILFLSSLLLYAQSPEVNEEDFFKGIDTKFLEKMDKNFSIYGTAVQVNKKSITYYTVLKDLKDALQTIKFDYEKKAKQLWNNHLRDIIIDILVREEIERLGLKDRYSKDIEKKFERFKKERFPSQQEFLQFLKEQKISEDSFRKRFETDQFVTILFQYKIGIITQDNSLPQPKYDFFIPPEDIYDYYKNNLNEFVKPAMVKVQIIGRDVNSEKEKEYTFALFKTIYEQLKAGGDPDFIFNLYNQSIKSENEENTIWFRINQLSPVLHAVIKNLKKGEFSNVVYDKKKNSIFIVRLLEKKDSYIEPFEEVQNKIEEFLRMKKMDEIKRKILYNMVKKAYIYPAHQKEEILRIIKPEEDDETNSSH